MSVSSRALALIKPPLPYISALINALGNCYSQDNPEGAIVLSVAENRLCGDLISEKLAQSLNFLPPMLLGYTSTTGLPEFRGSLAQFLGKFVFGGNGTINSNNLVLGSGCVSLIVQLSILLFEENDSVLVPAPYYPAFDNDFMNFGGVKVSPIFGQDVTDDAPFGRITEESLDIAYSKSLSEGFRPRGIVLTNPSNPLGTVYDCAELKDAIKWASTRDMHIIVDEIYALSLFPAYNPLTLEFRERKFVSVVEMLGDDMKENVHVLWSFSKDFSANGLRAGVLYTKNSLLLRALSSSNDPMMVSNITQYALQKLVDDETFVVEYLRLNSQKLHGSYLLLCNALTDIEINVLPAHGTMFAFCDFRRYLKDKDSFHCEQELFNVLNDGGILLTPGESCKCPIPGFFRICYAAVKIEVLKLALQRMKTILLKYSCETKAVSD